VRFIVKRKCHLVGGLLGEGAKARSRALCEHEVPLNCFVAGPSISKPYGTRSLIKSGSDDGTRHYRLRRLPAITIELFFVKVISGIGRPTATPRKVTFYRS